jgi:glycerophosphoryl diester phosphodiesterase
MMNLSWLTARPIAHRGLHVGSMIENTESSFTAALQNNYAIECDVQLTADGEAVVFHDDKVDRLLNARGLVKHHTIKQLKAMKFKGGSDVIQTLGELIEQVNSKATLVIELKSHWDHDLTLTRRSLEVLNHYTGPFALMSFDPDFVACMAELSPSTIRGITADRATDSYYDPLPLERRLALRSFSHLPATRPHFVSFDFTQLPYEPVSKLRASGHPVITWTIESQLQATEALKHCDQVTFQGYLPE